MERDYIGNLRVLIEIGHHSVSQQCLEVLRIKFDLTEEEVAEMRQYCEDRGAAIYDELEGYSEEEWNKKLEELNRRNHRPLTEEEKEYRELSKSLAYYIVKLGKNRTLNRNNSADWIVFCGTYTGHIRDGVVRRIRGEFSLEQLRFIMAHLPEDPEDKEYVILQDPLQQDVCKDLSQKLNAMIPRVGGRRINLSDYL